MTEPLCPTCGHEVGYHTDDTDRAPSCEGGVECPCQQYPAEIYRHAIAELREQVQFVVEHHMGAAERRIIADLATISSGPRQWQVDPEALPCPKCGHRKELHELRTTGNDGQCFHAGKGGGFCPCGLYAEDIE